MNIIPAVDLQQGLVVRAVAGRRHAYRPLRSRLAADPASERGPRAQRRVWDFAELYVADLDAIAGTEPAWDIFAN